MAYMYNQQIGNYLANYGYQQWQKAPLKKLLKKYPYLFRTPSGIFPLTNFTAEICTNSDSPIWSHYESYPTYYNQAVDNYIDDLLADGIIQYSQSDYNAPVSIRPQGECDIRMVIDYRNLNSETIPDTYRAAGINEILSQLGNNSYFSVLKLKNGYHQIPLHEFDMEKTAFSVHSGHYEFTRLPEGFKNSAAIFQRTLDVILNDHLANICYNYMGSILVFSQNIESHLYDLETIFQTLDEANILCDLERCQLLKSKVNFAGFLISNLGLECDPAKLDAIANYPCPQTIKSLRSFLGLTNFYRRFIRDYASMARTLTNLLHNNNPSKYVSDQVQIHLNESAMWAFNKLKSSLITNKVILRFPNFSQIFKLKTEVYEHFMRAELSQKDGPITYISRSLSKAEENYKYNEKEMLAIVWALDNLRLYMHDSSFIHILSDYDPEIYQNFHANNKQKWQAILNNYNYVLVVKFEN